MEPPFLALVVGIAVVAVAVLVYRTVYLWKQRRSAWEKVAVGLGLTFRDDVDLAQRLAGFRFFKHGRRHRTRIALEGPAEGAELILADHQYTTGGGNSQSTHYQTVCVLTSSELSLPRFALGPEVAVLDRIGELFGAQDVDFDDDPQFSAAFVLKGDDETRLRELFHHERRQRLRQLLKGRFHLEGEGQTLLFHNGRLVKPEQARDHMIRAGEILDAFRR